MRLGREGRVDLRGGGGASESEYIRWREGRWWM